MIDRLSGFRIQESLKFALPHLDPGDRFVEPNAEIFESHMNQFGLDPVDATKPFLRHLRPWRKSRGQTSQRLLLPSRQSQLPRKLPYFRLRQPRLHKRAPDRPLLPRAKAGAVILQIVAIRPVQDPPKTQLLRLGETDPVEFRLAEVAPVPL